MFRKFRDSAQQNFLTLNRNTTSLKPELQISQVNKKKWTYHRFLHRGPEKDVKQEYVFHFGQTLAKKISVSAKKG